MFFIFAKSYITMKLNVPCKKFQLQYIHLLSYFQKVAHLNVERKPSIRIRFYSKKEIYFSGLAFCPHVSGENGHRKRIFSKKLSERRYFKMLFCCARTDRWKYSFFLAPWSIHQTRKNTYRRLLCRQFWRNKTIFVEFMELRVGIVCPPGPPPLEFLQWSTCKHNTRLLDWLLEHTAIKTTHCKNKLFQFFSKYGISSNFRTFSYIVLYLNRQYESLALSITSHRSYTTSGPLVFKYVIWKRVDASFFFQIKNGYVGTGPKNNINI